MYVVPVIAQRHFYVSFYQVVLFLLLFVVLPVASRITPDGVCVFFTTSILVVLVLATKRRGCFDYCLLGHQLSFQKQKTKQVIC